METFTAEEIAEIVHELGLPAEVETDENHYATIEVKDDDLVWGRAIKWHGSEEIWWGVG